MKIILTYNFADEAVNDQNKQTPSTEERKDVDPVVIDSTVKEDKIENKEDPSLPTYREYDPEKDKNIHVNQKETQRLYDATKKHGHSDEVSESFKVYNTGNPEQPTSISASEFREAMIGKDRLESRNKLALINRLKSGGKYNSYRYNPQALSDGSTTTNLLTISVPYMKGKEFEVFDREKGKTKVFYGPQYDRIPYNIPEVVARGQKARMPAFSHPNTGSISFLTPGFDKAQIDDFYGYNKIPKHKHEEALDLIRASNLAQGITNYQKSFSDPKNALSHEIYHSLGVVNNNKVDRNNSTVLPKEYVQKLESKYGDKVKGVNFYNSYVSYDHNEAIPGLFVNKDELQQHNPDIVDPKQIETFDQIEKLFRERTYVDPEGVVRHRDDNSPVSEEMMRVWRMIEVDPNAKQIYQYYAPFVKNSYQYHQSKQIHA